ncbi:hypothetical protein [Pantoea piersonii]|uniref:hypothetical protein n=1 Tax=Pantoea piersonii TaxID=2364647 RepID=UPI00289A7322|nr:hypothetical protein [Pantoea piersonii]
MANNHHVYRVHDSKVASFKTEAIRKHPHLSIHEISTGSRDDINTYINKSVHVFIAVADQATLDHFNADIKLNISLNSQYEELSDSEFYI